MVLVFKQKRKGPLAGIVSALPIPGSADATVAAAHHSAREAADAGRLQPGTGAFNQKLKQLQQINNWKLAVFYCQYNLCMIYF